MRTTRKSSVENKETLRKTVSDTKTMETTRNPFRATTSTLDKRNDTTENTKTFTRQGSKVCASYVYRTITFGYRTITCFFCYFVVAGCNGGYFVAFVLILCCFQVAFYVHRPFCCLFIAFVLHLYCLLCVLCCFHLSFVRP